MILALVLLACSTSSGTPSAGTPSAGTPSPGTTSAPSADVEAVDVSGSPGAYTFAVTVRSDETGCDRYADGWEVVDATTGKLVYRRILGHSHPKEQPFTRTGGPVPATADEPLVVRAHLAPGGYGAALRGTATGGFTPWDATAFAPEVVNQGPQPDGCAF